MGRGVTLSSGLVGVGAANLTMTGPRHLYVPDPDPHIAFRQRPDYQDFVYGAEVAINAQGLRDRESPYEKPEGTRRILNLLRTFPSQAQSWW